MSFRKINEAIANDCFYLIVELPKQVNYGKRFKY